jgi:hypothetical protein
MDQAFEKILVEHCAPTLAGVKPANLFRIQSKNEKEIFNIVSYWNGLLSEKGTYVRLLKESSKTNSYLLLVYRKDWISQILSQKEVQDFLEQCGYLLSHDCDSVLEQLSIRLCRNQEFPHEVGVFLGYPLGDVMGFIQNKGKNFLLCGYWKAYEDPGAAQKYFKALRECTASYKNMYERGIPIVQMAVSADHTESSNFIKANGFVQ